jgi:hypothetical protein
MSTRRIPIALAIALGACASAHAADFPVNHALPDERLDVIRGGFDVGSLRASLGVERTVLVNGVEAIRQSVNIPDVAQMSIDQANQLRSVLSTTVVTIGAGGATSAGQATSSAAQASGTTSTNTQTVALPSNLGVVTLPTGTATGLVVQNSLDNQAITATTRIDASVNTSQMLQNMRIDESIKDAVIQFRGN